MRKLNSFLILLNSSQWKKLAEIPEMQKVNNLYSLKREEIANLGYQTLWFKGHLAINKKIKGYKILDISKLGLDISKWIKKFYSSVKIDKLNNDFVLIK